MLRLFGSMGRQVERTLAAMVDRQMRNLTACLLDDGVLALVSRDDPRVREPIRNNLAHVLAEAENWTVTIRRHGTNATQTLPLNKAVAALLRDVQPPRGGIQ